MATRPISNVINVWNQNTTYTGIGLNITDTLSGTNSKLLNLQINSGSKFYVDKNGNVVATGNISSSKFTASYARIGGVPSTSQYKFGDNSLPDLYSNKIRGYSGSFTYLEIISGSAPRAILPVIENVTNIKGDWDGVGVSEEHITFSTTGNDNKPRINIVADSGAGDGTINVNAVDLNLGGVINKTINFGRTWNSGPNNGRQPIEISGSHISFNPGDPNDCIDINGCLNLSGNLNIGGNFKIGPNSLYLSSSATESRIHGTNLNISSSVISASRMYVSRINGKNLNISSSVISASRMHVGGKTNTTQYKFYDGSKPDLYVNKLRAYSGSFTSVEIISGSNASMSIKNDKGKVIFESTVINNTASLTLIGNQLGIYASGDTFRPDWFSKNPFKSSRNLIIMSGSDFRMNNVTASLTGAFNFKGGANLLLKTGEGDFTGTLNINASSASVPFGLQISNTKIRIENITEESVQNRYTSSFDIKVIKAGEIKYENTHSINVGNGKVTIDGNTTTISADQSFGQIFFDFAQSKLKFGTQSLYITGSLISGSKFRIFAPDSGSSANIFYVTASKGTFTQLSSSRMLIRTLTASNIITASSAGISSGKYAKIKIGNQTYKLLLYNEV